MNSIVEDENNNLRVFMKKFFVILLTVLCTSVSYGGELFLSSQDRANFCDLIDTFGYGEEEVSTHIDLLASKYDVSVQEFVSVYSDTISCNGKHVILHSLDQGEEKFYGFIESGLNVNRVLPTLEGRNLTILDWAFIRLKNSEPHLKSMWRKTIYRLKKNLNAKKCLELEEPSLPCNL
jgi:hypothetical protein